MGPERGVAAHTFEREEQLPLSVEREHSLLGIFCHTGRHGVVHIAQRRTGCTASVSHWPPLLLDVLFPDVTISSEAELSMRRGACNTQRP